jgi:hypothetical protein
MHFAGTLYRRLRQLMQAPAAYYAAPVSLSRLASIVSTILEHRTHSRSTSPRGLSSSWAVGFWPQFIGELTGACAMVWMLKAGSKGAKSQTGEMPASLQ